MRARSAAHLGGLAIGCWAVASRGPFLCRAPWLRGTQQRFFVHQGCMTHGEALFIYAFSHLINIVILLKLSNGSEKLP
jgi:hypothetical protein